MYPAFVLVKKSLIYWRHSVDSSDDVTITKAIRLVNDKMF